MLIKKEPKTGILNDNEEYQSLKSQIFIIFLSLVGAGLFFFGDEMMKNNDIEYTLANGEHDPKLYHGKHHQNILRHAILVPKFDELEQKCNAYDAMGKKNQDTKEDNNDNMVPQTDNDNDNNNNNDDGLGLKDEVSFKSKVEDNKMAGGMVIERKVPKPILFAYYPESIDMHILRNIVDKLTGLYDGAKLYQISNVRHHHCLDPPSKPHKAGRLHTVACITTKSTKRSAHYNAKMVMVTRNPKTLFPFLQNMKQYRYHGLQKGLQEDKAGWEEQRAHIPTFLERYTSFFEEWKMSGYRIGLYLTYENIMDYRMGPLVIEKLGHFLRSLGYTVVPTTPEQYACVWYQSIGYNTLVTYHKMGYEYDAYFPEYTKKQKQIIIDELQTFMEVYSSEDINNDDADEALYSILKNYQQDVIDGATTTTEHIDAHYIHRFRRFLMSQTNNDTNTHRMQEQKRRYEKNNETNTNLVQVKKRRNLKKKS